MKSSNFREVLALDLPIHAVRIGPVRFVDVALSVLFQLLAVFRLLLALHELHGTESTGQRQHASTQQAVLYYCTRYCVLPVRICRRVNGDSQPWQLSETVKKSKRH